MENSVTGLATSWFKIYHISGKKNSISNHDFAELKLFQGSNWYSQTTQVHVA